jgi:RecA-family ATPase
LRSEIRTHRPELVVLDSVQQVFGQTDENVSTQVGEIYRFLFGLRDVYELTLLLVHHKRKGGNRWSEPLDLVRGSSAHGTQASTVWYAQPDGQTSLQLIQAKRRGGSKTSMIVAYSDAGPDGKITLQNRGAVPQREIAMFDTAATIIGYLKEHAEAPTHEILRAIADAGQSRPTGERALKQLARDGSIIRRGRGRYALPPDESVEATA